MTILTQDVKLLAAKVESDDPEGGGGPSGRVIPSGASNQIFTDVTSVDRAGGDVSIRQLHYHVQTDDTDRALDMYLMIARKPLDAAVDITLVECAPFAVRTEIAAAVASYFIPASEWGGYLLENHIKNQQNITLLQRPGTTLPTVGRTFYLVYDEGLITERKQAVRITKVEGGDKTVTFTDMSVNPPVDFQALRITLSLDQRLLHDFPGSPPSRGFARTNGKTMIRDSMAASASRFFGTAKTTAASAVTDDFVVVDSIYTQVVPSSRTPRNNPAERPGAQRTIVLATAPRRVEVGVTPHSARIKVGLENVSTSYTLPPLRPLPEPGTMVITYRALGQKYQVTDDGAGHLVGTVGESGAINYLTGLGNISLPALPDIGSVITIHWGERSAYTNRSSQGASVRRPEYAFMLDAGPGGDEQVLAGSFSLGYTSGGTVYTVTDSNGVLTGAGGTGRIDYPSRSVYFRPSRMPDPGAQFAIDYQLLAVQVELFTAPAPDAGGFITLNFAQQPAAGSLRVSWATARAVSNTSGGSQSMTSTKSDTTVVGGNVQNSALRATVPGYTPGAGVLPPGFTFEKAPWTALHSST